MSGVEVAGFVLGAIPLLISGIQIYHDGLVPIKIWLKYEGALERIMGDLRAERIKYKMTCERLLTGLVPNEQLAMLLDDPWGSHWKDAELLSRLEERLQEAYPIYLEQITAMKATTEEIRVKLGLDEKGKPTWTGKDRKIFKSEWKKISFSLSMGEHRELLQRLDKNNELLDNLTKTSVEFEPLRQERSRGSTYKALKIICDHAQNLYEALKSGWSCSCKSVHRASLRLETRSQAMARMEIENDFKNIQFGVHFSSYPDGPAWTTKIVPRKQQANLVLDKSMPIRATDVKTVGKTSFRDSQSKGFSMSYRRSKVSKMVNFSDHGSSSSTLLEEHTSLELSTAQDTPQVSKSSKIQDLCLEFQHAQGQEEILGFVESKDKRYEISSVQKQVQAPSFSLKEILLVSQLPTQPAKESLVSAERRSLELTRMERLQLATMLASTLLQLQTTPWLDENWGNEDIKFFRQKDDSLASQAYVCKGFSTSDTENSLQSKNHPIIRNKAIFALGIVLIELSESKSLESFQTPEDLDLNGQQTFMTEYLIATRLLKRVYEREGTRYGDAVRRCINCEFDERTPDFANDSFRRKVFEGVVMPLETVWEDFSRPS